MELKEIQQTKQEAKRRERELILSTAEAENLLNFYNQIKSNPTIKKQILPIIKMHAELLNFQICTYASCVTKHLSTLKFVLASPRDVRFAEFKRDEQIKTSRQAFYALNDIANKTIER